MKTTTAATRADLVRLAERLMNYLTTLVPVNEHTHRTALEAMLRDINGAPAPDKVQPIPESQTQTEWAEQRAGIADETSGVRIRPPAR